MWPSALKRRGSPSIGVFIDRFEQAFAKYTGADRAISVSNGTVALHLAYHCLGIGPGDEVIVPTFTYIASVNTIAQTGATPVFADCRPQDWLLDPEDVVSKDHAAHQGHRGGPSLWSPL